MIQLMSLRRLIDDGVRPDLLLVELHYVLLPWAKGEDQSDGVHRGLDDPRRHRVHPHARARVLDGERSRGGVQPALGQRSEDRRDRAQRWSTSDVVMVRT